jgi:hypothetical protein
MTLHRQTIIVLALGSFPWFKDSQQDSRPRSGEVAVNINKASNGDSSGPQRLRLLQLRGWCASFLLRRMRGCWAPGLLPSAFYSQYPQGREGWPDHTPCADVATQLDTLANFVSD